MQHANPRTRRNKRLHLVWFVDAASTKSASVSLRGLAIGVAGLAFLFAGSLASLALYANQEKRLADDAQYVRELKAGVLAQSMVFERALALQGREDEKIELAARARVVEEEIGRLSKAPIRDSAAKGTEAAELGKVSSTLTNLDNATLNLVAAGAGEDLVGDGGASEPTDSVPPLTNKGTAEVALTAKAPLSAKPSSSGPSSRLPAPAAPAAQTASAASAASAAVPEARADPATTPARGAIADASTRTAGAQELRVAFHHLTVGPVPAPLSKPSTADSDATEEADDATTNAEFDTSSTRIRFELANPDPTRTLAGRVCAVLMLRKGTGPERMEKVPSGLQTTPGGEPVNGCRGGQYIRFARLRPTSLDVKVPSNEVVSVRVYFSEGTGASLQTATWKAPNPEDSN